MRCAKCGGVVLWMGPLSNLTHTQCQQCKAINCQEGVDDERTELDDEDDASFEAWQMNKDTRP